MSDTTEKDFLAIVMIGAGSSFGRSDTEIGAVERCRKEAKSFARAFGGFKSGVELPVNVYDVTGFDEVQWGDIGVYSAVADGEPHIFDRHALYMIPHGKPVKELPESRAHVSE